MDFGVIVDVETTGLDAKKDQIIEIGLLEFAVEAGKPANICRMYSGLEDPGAPLSEEIKSITGLDNQILAGQKIDWRFVREIFDHCSIAIAHNANFDAGFIAQRKELNGLAIHWACSARHIDWTALGCKSKALNYIAADHGFCNPFAHRALFDCATTFRLVAPHLPELIERSYQKEITLAAVAAPFAAKDQLKQSGYRWDGDQRFWFKTVLESDLAKERAFLSDFVYAGPSKHIETQL